MALGPKKFDGKTYTHVICVDSKIRKNAVISDLKKKGYLYRAIKEGTYRNPIWCVYRRKKQTTTMKKVKSYQPRGKYTETSVDKRKKTVDFRLLQVSPNVIRWKGGKTETVTAGTLKKLQKANTWATDF